MRTMLFAALLCAPVAAARAESVARPIFDPNDTWSYRLTVQRGSLVKQSHIVVSVTRVGADGVLVSQKTDAAPGRVVSQLYGRDWSVRRSVNGQEITVDKPFAFPLEVGKGWRIEYTEQNPNPQKIRETDVLPFKVVGWEDVTVPAGKFHALKIEAFGRWTADLSPRVVINATIARSRGVAATRAESRVVKGVRVSGRYYKCFWYVPEVKRWVKSIEENYSANGSLGDSTADELEHFDVDDAAKPESAPQPSAPVLPPPAKAPDKNSI